MPPYGLYALSTNQFRDSFRDISVLLYTTLVSSHRYSNVFTTAVLIEINRIAQNAIC